MHASFRILLALPAILVAGDTFVIAQEPLLTPRGQASGVVTTAQQGGSPASENQPSDVLPLATGGSAPLPPLSATGSGCCLHPMFRCCGPDYCGCTPRIYYGTNPNDDDFVRELDSCPPHAWWYEKAFRMVLRKKHCAEVLDH